CAGAGAEPPPGELRPELRERVARNLAIGKPALITLEEAGAVRVANLPLELHVASAQAVDALLHAKGRFAWEAGASLPDFVDAFGRPLALTAVALEHARRSASGAAAEAVLERVYDRTPRFSEKLSGTRLHPDEQRVLALLDGRAAGREIVARARLPL